MGWYMKKKLLLNYVNEICLMFFLASRIYFLFISGGGAGTQKRSTTFRTGAPATTPHRNIPHTIYL